ncbi:MAG: PQQ-dependent sugar dehydrogenase [Thermodesulfobacteriota bacterium]
MQQRFLPLALPLLLLIATAGCSRAADPAEIRLPPGFRISLYADNLDDARSLALSPTGTLFVSTRRAGKVYAVLDRDGDGRGDRTHVVAAGLDMPNGIAFKDGALYVAEPGRLLRYDDIEGRLDHPGTPAVVYDDFPRDRAHGWKFIAFGPDGLLYVPVGAPCNICDPGAPYAALHRMRADGSGRELFARGIRNTVGFDWHPETGELWFTDNGRDWLGDDLPPDELNRAPTPGLHFGYPYRHGRDLADPEFGDKEKGGPFTPPAHEFQAHVAALGAEFYTGAMFPEKYRHSLFVAQHGSWNRSSKVGYRLVCLFIDKERVTGSEVFAEGWLRDGRVSGRPVDLETMADGSLLLSDDHAGAVYRISHEPARPAPAEPSGE